jgi:hypothetical protein
MRAIKDYIDEGIGVRIVTAAAARIQANRAESIGIVGVHVGAQALRCFLVNSLRPTCPPELKCRIYDVADELILDCIEGSAAPTPVAACLLKRYQPMKGE